jgi:hypothetical protein
LPIRRLCVQEHVVDDLGRHIVRVNPGVMPAQRLDSLSRGIVWRYYLPGFAPREAERRPAHGYPRSFGAAGGCVVICSFWANDCGAAAPRTGTSPIGTAF